MRIAVLISDERMKVIASHLKKDADVVEIDEDEHAGKLRMMASSFHAVVLPLHGVKDSGFVPMKNKGLYMAEFLEHLDEHCVLFTGKLTPFLDHLTCRKVAWLNDEKLLVQNAKLTAEGLLARIIETTDVSLESLTIDIVGTGRCGKACAELFEKLNLHFRMVTTSPKDNDFRFPWVKLSEWQTSDPSEIIINTAPVCILTQNSMKHWKSQKHVYDLATGFPAVEEKALKHPFLRLYQEGSLPARFASVSAAELIEEIIRKEMKL